MSRRVIRSDGAVQDLARPIAPLEIAMLLGVEEYERITIGDGWSVYIDAFRTLRGSALNSKASALTGVDVYGSAVVLPDADFPGGLPA